MSQGTKVEASPAELAVRQVLGRVEAFTPQARIAADARALESAAASIVNAGASLARNVGEEVAGTLPNPWPILRDLMQATAQYATPDPAAILTDIDGLLAPVVATALGLTDEQAAALRDAAAEVNRLKVQTPAQRLADFDRSNGKVAEHVESITLPTGSVVVAIAPDGEVAKSASGWGTIRGHAKNGRTARTPAVFDLLQVAVAAQQVNMVSGKAYTVTGLADGWTVVVTVPSGYAFTRDGGWAPMAPAEAVKTSAD